MNFAEYEICQCQNEACGQLFNKDNIHLAVCLYGVFFLVGSDKGYVGFTCPKCLKTNYFEKTRSEALEIKKHLSTMIRIEKHYKDKDGIIKIGVAQEFIPRLFYYSPFPLNDEIKHEFDIPAYELSNPGSSDFNIDELIPDAEAEIMEQNHYFCSFIDDSIPPAGIFTVINWFKEDDIERLVAYEMENDVKIFPRYHYYTDLHEKIDALLRFEYIFGKPFDKAKEDFQRYRKEALDGVDVIARENDLRKSEQDKLMVEVKQDYPAALFDIIENNQARMESAPTSPGEFLAVLTSKPGPLVYSLTKEPCDYLWSTIEPFENWDYPDVFLDTLSPEDTDTQETLDLHSKMADLVQKNSNIQDVQDFLRENLVDFLVEYESCVQSITFSYARIWKLKESYLEGLYKATNKGLRNNVAYAMFREGTGWKIVFNGKPFGGLQGKGFLWVYHIISNPGQKVYYRELHDKFESKKGDITALQIKEDFDEEIINELKKVDKLTISDAGVFSKQSEDIFQSKQIYINTYEKLYQEKEGALSKGNTVTVRRKETEMKDFLKFLEGNKVYYEVEGPKLSFSPQETKDTGNKKIKEKDMAKEKDKNMAKGADNKKAKGTNYKLINDKIKKNYRDAMKKLKTIRKAKDMHAHFDKQIKSEGGAFIYTPSEDIDWHLD